MIRKIHLHMKSYLRWIL